MPPPEGVARQPEELLREALVLSGTKERELARLLSSEAMDLWVRMRDPGRAAMAAIRMGDSYKEGRVYLDTLYHYERALEVKAIPGAVKARALNSKAQAYADLYHRDLASNFFNKALAEAQQSKAVAEQAAALMGLAHIGHQEGAIARAGEYISRARPLLQKQKNEEAEANLLHLAGQIDQEKGLLKQAGKAFEEAEAIYKRAGSIGGQVKVLCSISNLYLNSGQVREAAARAGRAVELAEGEGKRAKTNGDKLKARELRWRAWLADARAQRAAGNREVAKKSYTRAIHHIEGLWWMVYISTENSAVNFREDRHAPFRELADLLIEEGNIPEAYNWAESSRIRTALGLTEGRRLGGRPKNADREGRIQEISRSIARIRTQSFSPQISAALSAKLERDMVEAQHALEEARLKFELEESRNRVAWFKPATADEMQKRLAQEQAVMVEFFLGEARSFAWLITPGGISVEVLPGRKELEKRVGEFLGELTAPPNNLYMDRDLARLKGRAAELFSSMFGRMFERIPPGRKLIVVPDGVLHYVPVEALIRKGRYLIEDHEISYLPSATMLGLWLNSDGGSKPEYKMELLAFGDPIFGPEPKAAGDGYAARQVRAAGRPELASLPSTRNEVQFIANLFPPDRSKVFLHKTSTEDAVKKERLREYRRLHFATHSLIDEKLPFKSAVVLTLDDDPEEDGFLEVSEIAELDLDCDLVVLSACRTGRGKLLAGEGILGMGRAFFYAGARSVVVSLWNVSDISAGKLMKGFYQQMTANTGNPAALRQAKLQMLKGGGEGSHPFYWSSFVIIGKP